MERLDCAGACPLCLDCHEIFPVDLDDDCDVSGMCESCREFITYLRSLGNRELVIYFDTAITECCPDRAQFYILCLEYKKRGINMPD
ncbi:MAG: hypothetical protein ABL899_02125 [Nitrospira sp.]